MRFEIILILGAAFFIANIYTDGKYMKLALSWKKYYKMAGVAFGAFMLYWLIKKDPIKASSMIMASNEYIKYMPIDRNTANMISPILDFTAKQNFTGENIIPMPKRMMESGQNLTGGKTKRSVSETKKKYVAARQNWKCGDCQSQLTAWFEVDHKIRLEYGGSNHIDNLIALCRECHGKKTTIENL